MSRPSTRRALTVYDWHLHPLFYFALLNSLCPGQEWKNIIKVKVRLLNFAVKPK